MIQALLLLQTAEAVQAAPIWRFWVLAGLLLMVLVGMVYGAGLVRRLIKELRDDLSFVKTAAEEKEALIAELARVRERADAADTVVNRLIKTLGLRVDGSLQAMIATGTDAPDAREAE